MRGKRKEPPPIRIKALACLSRREHTRPELERKLGNKGYPQDEIRRTLDALEAESLLSHERFVTDYIRNAERRGCGPVRIRWELKSKQLDESEIEKGMEAVQMDWDACARRCCEKKFGQTPPADDEEYLKRRSYLQRRGFPGEIIRAVLAAGRQG